MMKKVILFLVLAVSTLHSFGQSTNMFVGDADTARYLLLEEGEFDRGNFFKFDTYTGKLKLIKVKSISKPEDTKVVVISH